MSAGSSHPGSQSATGAWGEDLAGIVRERLVGSPEADARRHHVEAVVMTTRAIAAGGGWTEKVASAAERAAWLHDALKLEGASTWRERIVAAGEEPDPWVVAQRPALLHAQAAAVWAAERGERDAEVLSAVRHHPTGHAEWGTVGRLLFVADFCEPTRPHASRLGTNDLVRRAAGGAEGLERSARQVLALRLGYLLDQGRPIHPESWRAWNAWASNVS